MNDYVLITDSTIDLPVKILETLNIEVIPMTFVMQEKVFVDGSMEAKDFYSNLRNKIVPTTSQISPSVYVEQFSKFAKEGKDILYVCFSSGLSGTYNSALIAAKDVMKAYPECKIVVVDSLCASIGEGVLVYEMALKKNNGATLEELADWAEKNKLNICHLFVVDDLKHLQRGGRISKSVALVGSMMNIKPVLIVDSFGKLKLVEKVRGKSKAADYMISQIEKHAKDVHLQTLYIVHGDCEEEAKDFANKIKEKLKVKNFVISNIGSMIGAHVGPGTLAVVFFGDKR
ncbi:MAG: DegV family protein [Clostridia bacterium]|nr:DegV family protein [Clostridia bacterium]